MGNAASDHDRSTTVARSCLSSAIAVMSTSRSGWTWRRFNIGPSDCPPARNFTTVSWRPPSVRARGRWGVHSRNVPVFTARSARLRRWPPGIRRGVIGEWSSSTPAAAKASFTPLTIAAGRWAIAPSTDPLRLRTPYRSGGSPCGSARGAGTSVGPGGGVVGECRGERLSRDIERHLFVQRGADPLGEAGDGPSTIIGLTSLRPSSTIT